MAFEPCRGCHDQIDPYARVLQNFGPIGNYRTRGRGRTTDRSRRHVLSGRAPGLRGRPCRLRFDPGFAAGAPDGDGRARAGVRAHLDRCPRRLRGPAAWSATPSDRGSGRTTRASSGPFARRTTERSSRFSSTCCWRTSCGPAREDRNDLVQVRPAIVPARRGRPGAPDASAVALDRGAGGRRGCASAPSGHPASAGDESRPRRTGAPNASATTTSFTLPYESAPFTPLQKYMVMVDGVNCVTASTGRDHRQPWWPEHGRGGHGCVDDRRSHASGWWASRITVPAGLPSISCFCRDRRRWAAPASAARRLSVRCSWPPTFGRTGTRLPRACCRTLAPKTGVTNPDIARQPLYPETSPLNAYSRLFARRCPRQAAAPASCA